MSDRSTSPIAETPSTTAENAPERPRLGFLQRARRSVARWFDSSADLGVHFDATSKKIDWIRSIPFFGVHALCLAVIWVKWSWIALGVAALLYFVRMFAVTGFYHRYFSHRTFKTSRAFQFVMAVAGNACAQRGPLWWAAHHRHHHKHSDKEEDLHSPHHGGFIYSHMLWIMTPKNVPTHFKAIADFAKFPELRFLDRFDTLVPFLLGAFLFFLGLTLDLIFPSLGTSGLQMLVWGFFISTVVLFHATCTINSLSHVFGRRRYKTGDHSRNSLALALLTLGEGWHNNHHHYPASTRQGFYWWEIDITYYMLRVLSWFGLIWDLKPVPVGHRETGRLR
jgi:stearoyl-CoA desaturase (delta-9 desaturase)